MSSTVCGEMLSCVICGYQSKVYSNINYNKENPFLCSSCFYLKSIKRHNYTGGKQ